MNTVTVKATWNTPLAKQFRSGFKKNDVAHVPLTPEECGSRYEMEKLELLQAIESKDTKVLLQWYYRDPDGELGLTLYDLFIEGFSTEDIRGRVLRYLYTPQSDIDEFLNKYEDKPNNAYVLINGEEHEVSSISLLNNLLKVVYDGGIIAISPSQIWYIDEEDLGFDVGNYIVLNVD